MEEVNRRNLQSMISPMPIDPVNPILMIVVKRESIVEHTLTQIMKCGPYDLKKPLKVMWNKQLSNRPFPSCCEPHYESEAKLSAKLFIGKLVLFAYE